MSIVHIYFGRNRSAQYLHEGDAGDITCPNGILGRLNTEKPSEARKEITVANNDILIFEREDNTVIDATLIAPTDIIVRMHFNYKNNYFVLEDYCYEDCYRYNSNTKTIDTYYKNVAGGYVYDPESASFQEYDAADPAHEGRTRYDTEEVDIPIQDKGNEFDAFIETPDIFFADIPVTDKQIELYINASVSVAGLRLNWASDTNTTFQETLASFQLGKEELTGSFENEVIRYQGGRAVVSKKITADSRVASAVRYKIIADFVNNGYDDIEIHDINMLTEMILAEAGEATNAEN
jgi:hypothetical protein